MSAGRGRVWPAVVLVLALIGASVVLQVVRDLRFATDQPAAQIMYVRSPELMKRLVLSYDALAADVYWIRAIQHFGRAQRGGDRVGQFELLHPLLDMATSLDPYFNIAYRFGAIFLSQEPPSGPDRPDLAIALLEKGLRYSPDKWQYMHDAGYVHYWSTRDYAAAAGWFERASRVPGAPAWLKPLAAVTLAKGGHRDVSRMLFQGILETVKDDEWMQKDAARRLRQLDAMDQIDQLNRIVAEYRSRGGAMPVTWRALVAARYLRDVPLDPDGFPYELKPQTGEVSLAQESTLWPLPVEPPAEQPVPPA